MNADHELQRNVQSWNRETRSATSPQTVGYLMVYEPLDNVGIADAKSFATHLIYIRPIPQHCQLTENRLTSCFPYCLCWVMGSMLPSILWLRAEPKLKTAASGIGKWNFPLDGGLGAEWKPPGKPRPQHLANCRQDKSTMLLFLRAENILTAYHIFPKVSPIK